MPDFSLEDKENGLVCGLDEVGRGPLAGSVVAACVLIPQDKRALPFVAEIRDSKKLSRKKLDYLFDEITAHFIYGIGACTPTEIDDINILQASLKAMERAFFQVHSIAPINFALVDGKFIPKTLPCPASAVVKGDNVSVSIAAASIVAKVTRDREMEQLAQEYPHYGWERNVGYPTKEHIAAIQNFGITDHHRRSFAPVRNFLQKSQTTPKRAVAI